MDYDLNNLDSGVALGLAAGLVGFFIVTLIISLICYLIRAISVFMYLRVRSYKNSWMAFIPIADQWAITEGTYGRVDSVNIYGYEAPATLLKLWTLVVCGIYSVASLIPILGNVICILVMILDVAVRVQIYQDMRERLNQPHTGIGSVVVVIINFISNIMIMVAAGKYPAGAQNWETDDRVLASQGRPEGPLSFLNKK